MFYKFSVPSPDLSIGLYLSHWCISCVSTCGRCCTWWGSIMVVRRLCSLYLCSWHGTPSSRSNIYYYSLLCQGIGTKLQKRFKLIVLIFVGYWVFYLCAITLWRLFRFGEFPPTPSNSTSVGFSDFA